MRNCFTILFLFLALSCGAAVPANDLFKEGAEAYATGGYDKAAMLFREASVRAPSAGALHNLGDAEWQCGHTGPAMLAWERAQWLNPFNHGTRNNLRFARKAAQLDSPDLTWYEICSSWLPVNAWAWIACLSFWLAISLIMLPGILRWRKADWHQALAAACFAIFLLTVPALIGVHSRSRIGIVLDKETSLRLTPTSESQVLGKLPGGEIARLERRRGNFIYIRTNLAAGWVERQQFGLIANLP